MLVAHACPYRCRFFGIPGLLRKNCQKTLEMAQGNVLILIKFFLAASG
jgi:hypothetical protein